MRSLLILVVYLLLLPGARSQSSISVEQYSFMGAGESGLLMPVAHYESSKKWYAEARYNYEDINTFSLYAGRTFSGQQRLSWSVTPMIGGMAGKLKGGSVGLNTTLSYHKFNFSSAAQYSVSADTRAANFFYNWSELYYQPFDWVYTGIALQHTSLYATNALVNPGVLLGFTYKQWSFPLYGFNPFLRERYFVAGINWEWNNAKSKRSKAAPPLVKQVP